MSHISTRLLVEDELSSNCTSSTSTQELLKQYSKNTTMTRLELDNKIISLHLCIFQNKIQINPWLYIYIYIKTTRTWNLKIENGHVESKTLSRHLRNIKKKYIFQILSVILHMYPECIYTSPGVWFMDSIFNNYRFVHNGFLIFVLFKRKKIANGYMKECWIMIKL